MKAQILAYVLPALILTNIYLADAQQPTKVARIGFLSTASASGSTANLETFRQGLRELGYIEGKNIIIEYRWAEGKLDRLPELAAELVSLGVDIIVTGGTPPVLAAKKATNTIPIVAANADNLVELGVVASLARPGGNVTGSTRVDADFSAKRVELLKESYSKAIPRGCPFPWGFGAQTGRIARDPGCGANFRGSDSILHSARG